MSVEQVTAPFTNFTYYDQNATVKDAIRALNGLFQHYRLMWCMLPEGLDKEKVGLTQAFAYRTIQNLREYPLDQKINPEYTGVTEEEVRERRSLIRRIK